MEIAHLNIDLRVSIFEHNNKHKPLKIMSIRRKKKARESIRFAYIHL